MAVVNRDQAEFWSSIAPTWIEMDHRLEETAGAPGRMAMDRLNPRPGQRLLDLGCGTGPTTVELAARVSPGGSVLGVDIAEEMLMRAAERAAEHGVDNVAFLRADVQGDDLGSQQFDGAFSRFGVMFFSDPVEAFWNVRRALRAGGRLSFACWQNALANEWMLVPGMAVMSVTRTPPRMPGSDEPGPFALSDPERVRSILAGAGFADITVATHDDFLTVADEEISEYAALTLRMGAAREALKDAGDAIKQQAYQAVVDALRAKTEDGQVRLARGVLLVTAEA